MATPLGQPSVEVSPGIWEGTTPAGLRRIIGSSYMSSGLLADADTGRVEGTSGWAYNVPAGAGFAWLTYASREGILIPWEDQVLEISAPSGGASRTDVIYVGADGVVKVREGASGPPRQELVLDRMVIPAGATNAASATSNFDINWAIPAGGSLGRLAHYQFPAGNHLSTTTGKVVYAGRFTVPSDRIIRIDLTACIASITGGTAGKGSIGINLDGTFERQIFGTHEVDEFNTISATWSTEVTAGAHTIEVSTLRQSGSSFRTAAGRTTSEMNIWDVGVAR